MHAKYYTYDKASLNMNCMAGTLTRRGSSGSHINTETIKNSKNTDQCSITVHGAMYLKITTE